ncbi:MAG: antibiotic biosynthesis monooxygenase [Pseudonocardiaceae bacterium]
MGERVVTAVDAMVDPKREGDLLDGFRQLNEGQQPDGLLRSELLRGQGGAWRIQTTWRDRDALIALRNSGKPPAALALLDRLGAEHSHAVFSIEQSHPV